jgi:integrase
VGYLEMTTLSTNLQLKNAQAGVYSVNGASGFGFKKASDEPGSGSYIVRYRLGGRRPTMGLGRFDEISLAEAREAAREAVKLARKGIDPIEQRKREREANLAAERAEKPVNFRQATEAYHALHAPTYKHKYAGQAWLNPIKKYAYPVIGELPVNDVSPRHIAAIMGRAETAGFYATAIILRGHINAVFNAAIANGDRDMMRGNPAAAGLIGAMRPLKRKGEAKHYRRIELDAAPAAARAIREAVKHAEGHRATALDAWLFMIAIAVRPSEAFRAQWPEVDLDKKLLTIPAPRMKGGRTHVVPLSTLALEVLARRASVRTSDAIFAGPGGLPIDHTNFALGPERAGIDAGTPHSWRSIFDDWAGDIGNVAFDLSEFALAHALPKTKAAYRHGTAVEPRRLVMENYARWLCGDTETNVIAFPSRA